jgi:hypothetical protein
MAGSQVTAEMIVEALRALLPPELLDRLTHKAHILEFVGESFRFRERMQREAQEEASGPGQYGSSNSKVVPFSTVKWYPFGLSKTACHHAVLGTR